MLKIYQTLVRMQYLDPSWIVEGPHNLDHVMSKLKEDNLDPDIIYLYSILPYIDNHGAEDLDFFQGGEFFDARKAGDLNRARDPFYMDVSLKPWKTPLSKLGNHESVIFYDARRHKIALEDQMGGSTDHVIRKRGREGAEDDGEEEDSLAEEEEGERNEYGNGYDDLKWRDAGDVLRDIVTWYEELVETPGGGEHSNNEWDHDDIKPLYITHGWPGPDFDGDAFLISKIRGEAARRAKYLAEHPIQEVDCLEGWLKRDEHWEGIKTRIEQADNVDDEWKARWELWIGLRYDARARLELAEAREIMEMDCPGGVCQKPEDLPLYEARELRREAAYAHTAFERLGEAMRNIYPKDDGWDRYEMKSAFMEKKSWICQLAMRAAVADADRLCPDRELPSTETERRRRMQDFARNDPKSAIEESEGYIVQSQELIDAIREWMKQVPEEGTEGVREVVEQKIAENEESIVGSRKRIEAARKYLESGKLTPSTFFGGKRGW